LQEIKELLNPHENKYVSCFFAVYNGLVNMCFT